MGELFVNGGLPKRPKEIESCNFKCDEPLKVYEIDYNFAKKSDGATEYCKVGIICRSMEEAIRIVESQPLNRIQVTQCHRNGIPINAISIKKKKALYRALQAEFDPTVKNLRSNYNVTIGRNY